MRRSSILAGVAFALTASVAATDAQQPMQRVQIGVLECRGGASVGFIVGSVTNLGCVLRAERPARRPLRRDHPQGRPRSRHHPESALAWGVFAPVGAARAGRSRRQLRRRAGQRDARRRRRRQRAGRRLQQFDRAAAAERAGPGRPRHCRRAGEPGTASGTVARVPVQRSTEARGVSRATVVRCYPVHSSRWPGLRCSLRNAAPCRHASATIFPLAKIPGQAEHRLADPITGRAPTKEAAMGQDVRSPRGPRCIALVGPFQSGKTTLLEAILARTGAIPKAGSVDAGTPIGDASAEARHHKMSTGLTAATTTFMGDSYTFIDCPGSVEFAHDMRAALPAVDAAIVVCEADEKKLPQLQIILRELEELGIPRFLFLNKIDRANKRDPRDARDPAAGLADAAGAAADSDLERRPDRRVSSISRWSAPSSIASTRPSEVVALEGGDLDREKEARFSMLEKLADHDDALMEQLLEDIHAAARCGVRRSRARIARRPDLSGAAGLGDPRERRAAADEGAAPRGARRRRDREAARRSVAEGCAGLCVQDRAPAARRQDCR